MGVFFCLHVKLCSSHINKNVAQNQVLDFFLFFCCNIIHDGFLSLQYYDDINILKRIPEMWLLNSTLMDKLCTEDIDSKLPQRPIVG